MEDSSFWCCKLTFEFKIYIKWTQWAVHYILEGYGSHLFNVVTFVPHMLEKNNLVV